MADLDAYAQSIREEVDGLVPVSELAAVDQLQAALSERLGALGIDLPKPEAGAALLVLAEALLDGVTGREATNLVLRIQTLGVRLLD